jgi:hypothetical protein
LPSRIRSLILVVASAALVVACTGSPTSVPSSGGSPAPEVLDFEAPLLAGGTFHGADLAGKDVAFWFWAPW